MEMRFLIFFLICSIFCYYCQCYQDYGFQDENEAAGNCTMPSTERPGFFDCVGYPSPRLFADRLMDGKDYCLVEVFLNGYQYFYCASKFPVLESHRYH